MNNENTIDLQEQLTHLEHQKYDLLEKVSMTELEIAEILDKLNGE